MSLCFCGEKYLSKTLLNFTHEFRYDFHQKWFVWTDLYHIQIFTKVCVLVCVDAGKIMYSHLSYDSKYVNLINVYQDAEYVISGSERQFSSCFWFLAPKFWVVVRIYE